MADDEIESKRTRVRCECGWRGQRRLPATCPCCDRELAAPPAERRRGGKPKASRKRVRAYTRLHDHTIRWLESKGNVGTEIARIVEAAQRSDPDTPAHMLL